MYRKITFVAMVAAALVLNTGQTTAQNTPTDSSYRFTLVKELPHTSPKDQYRSSTCWSFSTVSMLESELLRTGKGEFDLSDMFVVRKQYADKAANYIRYQGTSNFGPGGACHDVLNNWKQYGMVPEEAFQGLNYGEKKHVHSEMDEAMKAYLEAVNKNPNRKLSTAWLSGFNGIADAYLGKPAEKFTYKGKEYTPKTFADMLALNPDDYLEISSFTHHPYFTAFT
ncbi:MAG: aminopeptidase, partial [Bacteroidales bacterium]|nr:aminopeptidase [Bacteroidales bacterium]